jgi:hypothetical protein
MNKTIRTDRRYPLGDYRYVTFEDVLEVDGDLALNADFVSSFRYLQLVSFELAYRQYVKLVDALPYKMNIDEAIKALDKLREHEIKKLKDIINGRPLNEELPLEEEE